MISCHIPLSLSVCLSLSLSLSLSLRLSLCPGTELLVYLSLLQLSTAGLSRGGGTRPATHCTQQPALPRQPAQPGTQRERERERERLKKREWLGKQECTVRGERDREIEKKKMKICGWEERGSIAKWVWNTNHLPMNSDLSVFFQYLLFTVQ